MLKGTFIRTNRRILVRGNAVDGSGAVCILMLIPLSWEELQTRSESLYSGDFLGTNPLMNKGANLGE